MTSLLRRAAICAGLAACASSTLSQAQDTTTVLPRRTELRRALPVATAPVAAPMVQQSPNGLYKLSITDTGIELLGPKGAVRITDTGIEITGTNTPVAIRASDMNVMIDRTVRLDAGSTMNIRAGSSMDIKGAQYVQLTTGSGTMKLDADATLSGSRVMLGCTSTNGRPAARAGDQVNTTASPAVIAQGSQTVLVC